MPCCLARKWPGCIQPWSVDDVAVCGQRWMCESSMRCCGCAMVGRVWLSGYAGHVGVVVVVMAVQRYGLGW